MHVSIRNIFVVALLSMSTGIAIETAEAENRSIDVGGFIVEHELTVAVTPEVAYENFTGDILPWWDHTFSENPVQLWIEPFPGGRFYELSSHAGDGVLHAVVLVAERGKRLRFEGPLGLSGNAIQMVHTLDFEAAGDGSTSIKLSIHAVGERQEGWADAVDRAWHHFLFERYKPYVESQPDKVKSRRNE